jgi:hypothetical protein
MRIGWENLGCRGQKIFWIEAWNSCSFLLHDPIGRGDRLYFVGVGTLLDIVMLGAKVRGPKY